MRECLRVHKDVVVVVSLAGSAFTPTVGLRVTRLGESCQVAML